MKRIVTMLCAAVFATASLLGKSMENDSKTLVVKPVFTTTQNTTTDWGGSIDVASVDPRYEMSKVDGTDNLYKCTIKLNAYFKTNKWKGSLGEEYNPESPNEGWNNEHWFVVVYQDNYGDQVDKNNPNAADKSQSFKIEEDGTEVTFYAVINADDKIRSYCDAQAPTISIQNNSAGNVTLPAAIGETTTSAPIYIDGSGKIEIAANNHIFNPDGKAGKYAVYSRGNHVFKIDFTTISYSITKILDNVTNPQIQSGNEEAISAPTTVTNIGTFTANNPLHFAAKINGASATTSPFKVEDVEANLYYEIIPTGETNGTEVKVPLKTTAQDEQTVATWESDALNLSEGLADGEYTLKFWYEANALGNTIIDDNNGEKYTVSFSSYNGLILNTLEVSKGTLTPEFASNVLDYTVNVERDIAAITFTATAASNMEISGHTGEQALDFGTNNFAITVRPQGVDNVSETYNITVNRAKNNDATLSELSVTEGTLTPAFSPEVLEYTVDVANDVTTISVTATVNDTNASVTGTGEHALEAGDNTLEITVTAQDGTVQTYTIVVNRAKSSDATLSALSVTQGTLTPAFSPEVLEYTVDVENNITIIGVTATTNDANASVTGAGDHVLTTGENTLKVVVTAQDESTQTYTIVVNRAKPNGINQVDAEVKITVENGTIHAIFDQVTSIRLYTISGLLLDTTDTTDYTQAVTKGLYILSVNGKPYKILVE